MANPFDHFGSFLLAVYSHLFTLLAGCVLTVILNFIEKHTPLKGKMTWKVDLGIVLLFLFFACFQAWQDEYRRASDLDAQLRAKPLPQQPPPLINVNVPPPVVNIPHDGAYVTVSDPSLNSSEYRIGGHLSVSPTIKNLSATQVAMGVKGLTAVLIINSFANDTHQSLVFQKDEDAAWNQFMTIYSQQRKNMPETNYGPSQNQFVTLWTPQIIDSAIDAAFRGGTKTIMILSRLEWSDDRGSHTNDFCEWLQDMPGVFIGPGQIGGHMVEIFHQCGRHNGLVSLKIGGV
jgi:hypothetical protein